MMIFLFFFTTPAPTKISTLSLHDALPILSGPCHLGGLGGPAGQAASAVTLRSHHAIASQQLFDERSEEHTSELQSRFDLVCRLLLEKKKKKQIDIYY